MQESSLKEDFILNKEAQIQIRTKQFDYTKRKTGHDIVHFVGLLVILTAIGEQG